MKSRVEKLYREVVINQLRERFSYSSVMQVPKVSKVTLNMGVGEAVADKKVMTNAVDDLTKIAGQKAVVAMSKRAVAGFKIRAGWPVGCKVTLRGDKMYEFIDRLVSVVIPRIRDFRGLNSRSFDGRGNYNLGIKEQIVFPEIDYDKVDALRGLDIAVTTTAKSDEEARYLLLGLGFPLKESR